MPLLAVYSVVELVLSFIGTGIAGALYYAHQRNIELPCSSGGGCDLVNASHWAYVNGIPLSLIGTIGYIALTLLSVIKLNALSERARSAARTVMLLVTLGGVCFSWYLQYVAAFYIGAFCIYCRSSAIVMTLLFATVLLEQVQALRSKRRVNISQVGNAQGQSAETS